MPKPELSIIIVSYNTKKLTQGCLESCLKSLKNAPFSYEIVVVDNASTDGSPEMLKMYEAKLKERFKPIPSDENIGFGKGNNLGAKHAQGKYILFLNSDIVVLNEAISKLFQFYRQNEGKIHFLGGKLLNKNMTDQNSAAWFFTLPVVFAIHFLRGDHWNFTRFSPNKIKMVDWVSGACILTKKNYFDALEGFDRDLFMYMEEVDLLYRAKQKGYLTYFYPEARFIHLGSGSSAGRTFPIIQVYQGLLYFYKKHRSRTALFWLKFMLKLKALIAVYIGKVTKNQYLIETYEKAYQLVKMGR